MTSKIITFNNFGKQCSFPVIEFVKKYPSGKLFDFNIPAKLIPKIQGALEYMKSENYEY